MVAADINNDGHMDLYVTNDTVPNFLFANRGKGKFEEIGTLGRSRFEARLANRVPAWEWMPPTTIKTDGSIPFEANVDHEMYSLYHNDKNEVFTDVANPNGIGAATRMMSGWDMKFF